MADRKARSAEVAELKALVEELRTEITLLRVSHSGCCGHVCIRPTWIYPHTTTVYPQITYYPTTYSTITTTCAAEGSYTLGIGN